MKESIKYILMSLLMIIIVVSILFGGFYLVVSNDKQTYQNKLTIAKDIANNSMITNTTYKEKIDIILNSCEFVFGESDFTKYCKEDLLEIYK